MNERFGTKGTIVDGIFFTESSIERAVLVGKVAIEISRQNADLSQVKIALASQAKAQGANAVTNFTYGQRAHLWWELLRFKWDQESWHGEGKAVTATE